MITSLSQLLMLMTRDATRYPPRKALAERPWLAVGLHLLFTIAFLPVALLTIQFCWNAEDWTAFWSLTFAAFLLLPVLIWRTRGIFE
ncbi:MAG: hypothetical protein H0X24_18340 [Ktedonobacterales bacterium]|nr:hypothetical protein [Ktedonobacterales bacterium]